MAFVSEGMYIPWLSDNRHHASDIKNLSEVKVCITRANLTINAHLSDTEWLFISESMYIPMLLATDAINQTLKISYR
jgi:hypothetical protein